MAVHPSVVKGMVQQSVVSADASVAEYSSVEPGGVEYWRGSSGVSITVEQCI